MNGDDHPELLSETWDPRNHTRLHFPVLEHPDARPEQAPSQGVRQLLYQYEAAQSVSRAPLNIFWNDEENDHPSVNSEEDDDDIDGFLRELRGEDDGAAASQSTCNALTICACLIILCSATALLVGAICKFGPCGVPSGDDSTDWGLETLFPTSPPTSAPTGNAFFDWSYSRPSRTIPPTLQNIFVPKPNRRPTRRPTQQPTPPNNNSTLSFGANNNNNKTSSANTTSISTNSTSNTTISGNLSLNTTAPSNTTGVLPQSSNSTNLTLAPSLPRPGLNQATTTPPTTIKTFTNSKVHMP